MPDADNHQANPRVILIAGKHVGLAVMLTQDIPIIARWNQDLEFTARIGTPGEAHTVEMRQDAYQRNSKIKPDSAEFAVIELCTGRLVGFCGVFDITRALVATAFVGIGEADVRRKGYGTEATRLLCEYAFFFRNLHSIKVEVHAYNSPARRVYERLGFKTVGRLRGVNLLNDRRYDEIIMDLLRSEFELQHVARFDGLENDGN